MKSRADSTTETFVRVIRKFLDWSKRTHFNMQLPFPLSVVSLYLFEVQQSGTSSSSVVLAHAALKWLHSFIPSLDRNPLDRKFYRNIIESAKRQKSQPTFTVPTVALNALIIIAGLSECVVPSDQPGSC